MSDLLAMQLMPNQSNVQPAPPTIASAATIAPTHRMNFVTGTVQVATITPFTTGHHSIILIFTNGAPGAFLTTGNIQRAFTPQQNVPIELHYDPAGGKYWVGPGSGVA